MMSITVKGDSQRLISNLLLFGGNTSEANQTPIPQMNKQQKDELT